MRHQERRLAMPHSVCSCPQLPAPPVPARPPARPPQDQFFSFALQQGGAGASSQPSGPAGAQRLLGGMPAAASALLVASPATGATPPPSRGAAAAAAAAGAGRRGKGRAAARGRGAAEGSAASAAASVEVEAEINAIIEKALARPPGKRRGRPPGRRKCVRGGGGGGGLLRGARRVHAGRLGRALRPVQPWLSASHALKC